MYLKLALRDLRGSKKLAFLFVLNLTMGLAGFTGLDAFKTSFQKSMADSSRNLLTADVEVSARRMLSPEDVVTANRVLGKRLVQHSEQITLYSMVAGPKGTRLAEIKAVDDLHPLYGKVGLKNAGEIIGASKKDIGGDQAVAWVYPELLTQLGAEIGGMLTIGSVDFRVSDILLEDSGLNWAGAAVAPRIYIGLRQLSATGLIRPGSTVWNGHLFKLSPEVDAESVAKELRAQYTDPAIRINSHQTASEQTGRLLRYLNDYLGLVALSALFLACLGSAFLYRSFLAKKMREIAILLSLGATPGEAMKVCILQLTILGGMSAILAFLLAAIGLPILPIILRDFLPADIVVTARLESLLAAFILSVAGSVLMALPMILKLRSIKPRELFQEHILPTFTFTWRDGVAYIPILVLAWCLAVWQSHSIYVGSLFIVAFLLSAAIIGLIGAVKLSLAGRHFHPHSLSLKLAILQMSRNRVGAVTVFLALGLGTLMLNLIPQVKAGLETELNMPQNSRLPSLFMFDIQDDQVGGVQEIIRDNNLVLNQLSPMIRARLVSINGIETRKIDPSPESATREEERTNEQRNRHYNLSYRQGLAESEAIVAGQPLKESYDPASGDLPEISLEVRFAGRMDMELGDILEFDIQGVAVKGKVANLRSVRWTSFQPNFFIQFQPGVLESAPKTYLAALPAIAPEHKTLIQNRIVERYSNISIVDVSRVVKRILEIVDRMSWVLTYMAWLTLAAGFIVLFSIADYQVRLRQKDTALLKVLGASFQTVQAAVLWEFGLIGIGASALGATLAIGFSWGVSWIMFDGLWVYNLAIPAASSAVVSIISILAAYIATARTLRSKPLLFLQESN